MSLKLFDAHCHLQFPHYQDDLPEVLVRMKEKDMGAIVIGTDFETSKAGLELAKQQDFLWASVGLHPNDNTEEVFNLEAFEALAKDPKVVAIGECGLDYFRSGGTPEEKTAQKERFEKQIDLALTLRKPLIIHGRNAHDDMLAILSEKKLPVPIIMHFFTADEATTKKYLELGCYLSFPGPITYTDMYDESIRVAPIDKILVETDAPFAAPVPFRGKRNEPSYVQHVAQKIATVKQITLEEVARQTILTAQCVFGLS
jgi:TatD DNase family protein